MLVDTQLFQVQSIFSESGISPTKILVNEIEYVDFILCSDFPRCNAKPKVKERKAGKNCVIN